MGFFGNKALINCPACTKVLFTNLKEDVCLACGFKRQKKTRVKASEF